MTSDAPAPPTMPARGKPPARGPYFACDLVAALPPQGGPDAALVYRRRQLRPRPAPAVARGDVTETLLMAGAAALARAAGPATWEAWCQRMARTRVKGGGGARGNVRTGLAAALGLDDPAAAEQIFLGGRASFFRQQMLYAAEAAGRSPGAIDFDPDDVDRLRAALARGRGAIVWVDETCAGPIIAKRALAAAGFAPRHVSAHLHGVSFTGFGLAMLNPRHLRAENRYLAERLVFGADETADVLRRVLRALKAGGVVTMTNGVFSGSGFVELPFGPRGRFSLSTTALGLSIRHGAPLFTLAAVELEPFARYRIELGPEIVPAPGQTDGGHGAVVAGACAARDQILARLRRWPEQYPALPGGRFETTRFPELRPAAH